MTSPAPVITPEAIAGLALNRVLADVLTQACDVPVYPWPRTNLAPPCGFIKAGRDGTRFTLSAGASVVCRVALVVEFYAPRVDLQEAMETLDRLCWTALSALLLDPRLGGAYSAVPVSHEQPFPQDVANIAYQSRGFALTVEFP